MSNKNISNTDNLDNPDEVINIPEKPFQEPVSAKRVDQKQEKIEGKGVRKQAKNVRKWLKEAGWSSNPFTFRITPSMLVGYNDQREEVLSVIEEKHKIILITGPTGSGKTTLLKWVAENLSEYESVYIAKPPKSAENFVRIFNNKFRVPWILRPFISNIKNLDEIPDFLNKKLKNKHLVVLFDESHEADIDILEWLRVLSDHVENMSIILSALPIFEDQIKDKLETLRKRIIVKIELLSLTKEEIYELIKKRIASVGGNEIEPFTLETIGIIYDKTGGFPREVIRQCNDLMNLAIVNDRKKITPDLLEEEVKEKSTLTILDRLTGMQKNIIEFLSKKSSSPGEIANMLNLEKYKSRQHAVRSINNILKVLLKGDLVEREKMEKTFVYKLSPRIKTLVVKA